MTAMANFQPINWTNCGSLSEIMDQMAQQMATEPLQNRRIYSKKFSDKKGNMLWV